MKPSIPKGTRDFSPLEMAGRNFIFSTIRKVYEKFGFQQIETPAMENSSTLLGKYGNEGDKLIFRILNSGNYLENVGVDKSILEDQKEWSKLIVDDKIPAWSILQPNGLTKIISEKALRYDLTVPFARYVVMHQNEITFPFKRYQIQPVWRADRPQKGRYREFYQCDADIIGSDSLLNEVELIQIIDEVFSKLGVKVTIKINNRKILEGIAEVLGVKDRFVEIINILDNIDKVGLHEVQNELAEKFSFSEDQIEFIRYLSNSKIVGSVHNMSRLADDLIFIKSDTGERCSEVGIKGVNELVKIYSYFQKPIMSFLPDEILKLENVLEFDPTLARGLSYYTGTIIEVKVNDSRSTFKSSVLGGGRYDDLTGIFGLPNVSGVGISFGVDRIYDVMEECEIFEQLKINASVTKLLFVNFGGEEELHCLNLVKQVRDKGINAEIYPDAVKIKKQMSYADDNRIPFVAIIGTEEMEHSLITLKNMQTGEQEKLSFEMLMEVLNKF